MRSVEKYVSCVVIILSGMIIMNKVFAQERKIELSFKNCEESVINTVDYSLVLSSEIHWQKNIFDIRFAMIKHLIKDGGLDKLIIEDNYAIGYLINKYIDERDTVGLKRLFTIYREWEYYHELEDPGTNNLYEYYLDIIKLLDENNESIEVIGIDINHYHTFLPFILTFQDILQNDTKLIGEYPKSIEAAKLLVTKDNITKYAFKSWFKTVRKESKKSSIENSYLQQLMSNIDYCLIYSYKNLWRSWKWREKIMHKNISNSIRVDEKTYGQFGLSHVTLKKAVRFKSFATLLNEEPLWKGQILSIGLICQECQRGNYRSFTEYRPFLKLEEFASIKPLIDSTKHLGIIDLRELPEVKSDNVQLLLNFRRIQTK